MQIIIIVTPISNEIGVTYAIIEKIPGFELRSEPPVIFNTIEVGLKDTSGKIY